MLEPNELLPLVLLAPEGHSVSLQVIVDHDGIKALPIGYGNWLLWVTFVPVAIGFAVAAVYTWDDLTSDIGGIAAGFVMAMVAGVFGGIVYGSACYIKLLDSQMLWLDSQMIAYGPFFHADKNGQWLSLPRSKVRLARSEILGFIEVRANYVVEDQETKSIFRLGELSVLVKGAGGQVVRYPVVTALRRGLVHKIGIQLAGLFQVEYQYSKAIG